MMQSHHFFCFLFAGILVLKSAHCYGSYDFKRLEPKKSCLDHYLNGQSNSGIFPINTGADAVSHLECGMPSSPESESTVKTVVHSALESWTLVRPGKRATAGYQITDRNAITTLLEKSESCVQELFVKWPRIYPENVQENQIIGFTIESLQGIQRTFQRNLSTFEEYQEAVILQFARDSKLASAPVFHVLGTDSNEHSENETAWIRAGPLTCGQKIVDKIECLFELNEKSDWIKLSSTKNGKIQFSFRTDRPETSFLKIFLTDGSSINIDLVDGYLLTVAHMIHPAKLLADGKWHTVSLDSSTLTLEIDGSTPIISFAAISEGNPLVELQILLNGQISAIKTGDSDTWICSDSKAVERKLTEQILRKICPEYEDNFCNCQAPRSVLSQNKCPRHLNRGYYLSRTPNQLAFFHFDKFSEKSTVNVVFRSDSDYGLVMFAVVNNNLGRTRIQVHFVNERMQASVCVRSSVSNSDKCRSCIVKRERGFADNKWVSVSYFHFNDYQFMSVDNAVCRLAPEMSSSAESLLLDGATMYEADQAVESALFVGGAYYTKTTALNRKIEADFRRKFLDHTNEKSPSLRGCINSITINGQSIDLKRTLEHQVNATARGDGNVFSIDSFCRSCESGECNGATCRAMRPFDKSTNERCDCASVFSTQKAGEEKCHVDSSPVVQAFGSLPLATSYVSDDAPRAPKIVYQDTSVLEKLWMLLLLPEVAEELHTIVSLGAVNISVADFGKRVVVDVGSLREDFEVASHDDRLHLIALQKMSSTGTASGAFVRVQVDNQLRDLEVEDIPIHSNHPVYITPIFLPDNGDSEDPKYPGCLQELTVSFNYRDNGYRPNPSQEAYQKDILHEYMEIMADSGSSGRINTINKHAACGIRDPSFWSSNSSSFGVIGPYDPYGAGSTSSSISILVTVLVCLLILAVLVGYCYCRQRKTSTYRLNMAQFKPHPGKDEKEPLKHGFMDISGSSTDHSHLEYPDSPPVKLSLHQHGNNGVARASPVVINPELLETPRAGAAQN